MKSGIVATTIAPKRGRQNKFQKTGWTNQRYMPSDFVETEVTIRRDREVLHIFDL